MNQIKEAKVFYSNPDGNYIAEIQAIWHDGKNKIVAIIDMENGKTYTIDGAVINETIVKEFIKDILAFNLLKNKKETEVLITVKEIRNDQPMSYKLKTEVWTLSEMLGYINDIDDHPEDWIDYNEFDWRQGWIDGHEGEFYKIVKIETKLTETF